MKFKEIAFLLCVVILFTGCKEQIVHDLTEYEANRVITSLDDIGLQVSKEKQADGKWTILVPGESVMTALKHLSATRAFAVRRAQKLDAASVVSSREDRQFRYERALSAEIESTLRSIGGVLDARVHLNIAPTDPVFGRPLATGFQGSASVLLIANNQLMTDESRIGYLVHGASGVPVEKISVLISPGVKEGRHLKDGSVGQSSQENLEVAPVVDVSILHDGIELLQANQQFILPLFFVAIGVGMLWRLSPFS